MTQYFWKISRNTDVSLHQLKHSQVIFRVVFCDYWLASGVNTICSIPLVNIPLPLTSPKQEWVPDGNVTGAPYCYIQQVVLKVAVLPWDADLRLGDGFRAPLYESFKLLDIVRNYQDNDR